MTLPGPGPVPQSVWVKTGALRWWCDWKPHKWVDVRVALEQFTGHDGARDSILFVYYVVHEEKKVRAWAGRVGVGAWGGGAEAWDPGPEALSLGPNLAPMKCRPQVTESLPVVGRCVVAPQGHLGLSR